MSARSLIIEGIEMSGFGHFVDYRAQLGPGLNVLYGPNEAGKSTVMAFVRDVLFGFPRKGGPDRDLMPVSGGSDYGGALHLRAGNQRYEVRRLSRRGRSEGELQLFDAKGQVCDPGQLSALLGGVGRTLFGQVFSFTVDELQSFSQLAGEHDVSEALLVAALPGANGLPRALKSLEKEQESWGPRRHKAPVSVELARLQQLREAIERLGDLPRLYAEGLSQHEALKGALSPLTEQRRAANAKVQRFERLVQALPDLSAARSAQVVLSQLPRATVGAVSALAAAQSLSQQLAASRADVAQAGRGLSQANARVDQLRVAFGERADIERVERAVEVFGGCLPLMQNLAAEQASLDRQLAAVASQRARLGLSSAQVLPDVGAMREGLVQVQPRAQQARRDRELAEARLERAQAALASVNAEVERLQATVAGLPSGEPDAVRAQLVAFAELTALGHQWARARASVVPSAPDPANRRVWVAATVVAAVAIVACGLIAGASGVVAAVLASALGATGLWFGRRGSAPSSGAFDSAQLAAQLSAARARAGVAEGEDALAAESRAQALLESVLERRRLQLRLEGLQPQQRAAHADVSSANASLASADASLDQLGAQLAALLGPLDERCGGDAAVALAVVGELERVAADEQRHALLVDELAAKQAQVFAARAALAEVAPVLGSAPPDEAALFQQLRSWAQQTRALSQRLQVAVGQAEALIGPHDAQQARAASLQSQLQSVLDDAKAASLGALQSAAQLEQQRSAAETTLREALARAEAALGVRPDDLDEVHQEALNARESLDDAAVEWRSLDQRHQTLHRELGASTERLDRLKADQQIGALQAEVAQLSASIAPRLHRWAAARVATLVLERARSAVEQKNQPRVARYASEAFARLTGGRYLQVLPQPDSKLLVKDDRGRLWAPEQLSRGTRELLLVAFRLAVAKGFGEDKVALPMLLDDVLVNFDPERAGRLVTELVELGDAGHQVLAFTCHPHLKSLLAGARAHLVEVTARSQLSLLG